MKGDACKWCVHSCLYHMILSNRLVITKTWKMLNAEISLIWKQALISNQIKDRLHTSQTQLYNKTVPCSLHFTDHGYRDTHKTITVTCYWDSLSQRHVIYVSMTMGFYFAPLATFHLHRWALTYMPCITFSCSHDWQHNDDVQTWSSWFREE